MSDLECFQVEALKYIVKKIIYPIGWTIMDITSIDPEICSQKIKLKVDDIPSIKNHKRRKPSFQVVVKKDIIKFLDAGIIYPISTSTWVIPIQYIPKKVPWQ